MSRQLLPKVLIGAALLAVAAACSNEISVDPKTRATTEPALSASSTGGKTVEQQLADLTAATVIYRGGPSVAADSGWSSLLTDCMSDPTRGGMGFHYGDLTRFDTTLDANRPEILVYAPKQDGTRELVAVEYAVPLAAWKHNSPPKVLGQYLHVNAQFQLWVLHAWVHRANPSGVFSDWNPTVTCPATSTAMPSAM